MSSSLSPLAGLNGAQYDVFPDSQRFVTIAAAEASAGDREKEPIAAAPIRIVQNWYEEFRDRKR